MPGCGTGAAWPQPGITLDQHRTWLHWMLDARPQSLVTSIPLEREVAVDVAIASAETVLRGLGLRVVRRAVNLSGFVVHSMTALDRDGRVVSRSAGKGAGIACEASALFELIEFYALHRRSSSDDFPRRWMRADDVAAQAGIEDARLVLHLCDAYKADEIEVELYHELGTGTGCIWYPVSLRNPMYHAGAQGSPFVERFRHYCTSVGVAAGSTVNEAVLHALCEIVEHDAFSETLLSWYLTPRRSCFKGAAVVAPHSLPDELGFLMDGVRSIGVDPVLCLAERESGPRAFFAINRSSTSVIPEVGLGASLWSAYGAERAIRELAQDTIARRELGLHSPARDIEVVKALGEWPWMSRAAEMSVPAFAGTALWPADASERKIGAGGLAGCIAEILSVLGRCYYRPLLSTENVVVVDVLCPGAETIDRVRHGWPVPPTGRFGRLLAGP